MDDKTIWVAAVGELQLQMTRATFNTHLARATFMDRQGDVFIIAVPSLYVKEWLDARLVRAINKTLSAVAGRDVSVEFRVVEESRPAVSGGALGAPEPPIFPGFEPYRSNFVQTPRQFFEIVVPKGPPAITAFVAAVIDQTIGTIINFNTMERREYWEASYSEIGVAAGLGSSRSVWKAIKVSLELGYVVRRNGDLTFKYRLRRQGEPVDNFDES